jgi:phage baseplate assembly protein W
MPKFSDINQFDKNEQKIITDIDCIYQSIDNILSTQKDQRLFLPEFGVDLSQYLFEPMTIETLFALKNEIINAVETWEPRVILSRKESFVEYDEDEHYVNVFLVFRIKGLTDEEYVYQTNLGKNKIGQYYAK